MVSHTISMHEALHFDPPTPLVRGSTKSICSKYLENGYYSVEKCCHAIAPL
jgi:hypothetical protein